MIVVDASLAAKWVAWEADSVDASRFLARWGSELAAPDLLLSEVASSIVRRARMGEIDRRESDALAEEWADFWRGQFIQSHRLDADLIADAIALALQLDHKLPDCIYLALAIRLDCDLATCDRRFHTKASTKFPQIKLLADFDLA